ncbi:hypothetical protein PsorP6_018106 [Peronosclerospora sorghi]|uniref:Uncharacterized protein n=1 Tax=Peronosclerospora sorghi TaxID=230839 RepID=A0ACC0WE64_9STRA|nr:hypothetical protein PsorP6_018106 [Peronosclerospora sorghi]
MRLLLVVVIVLSSIAVVVKSSLDLVPHDVVHSADFGRNGARTVRYLRSSAGGLPDVPVQWITAFVQVRKQFFDAESKTRPFLKPPSKLNSIQRNRLKYFFRADPIIAKSNSCCCYSTPGSIVDRVKIVNAMKMSDDSEVRSFAEDLEKRLLEKWDTEGRTLQDVFVELQLNEIQDEMDLYFSPASPLGWCMPKFFLGPVFMNRCPYC